MTARDTLSAEIERYLSDPRVGVETVVISANALEVLRDTVEALPRYGSIAILTDESSFLGTDGSNIKSAVAAALDGVGSVEWVTLAGDVHADETTVALAVDDCAQADVVVTVGSGTLCDIGKVAANGKPHIVIQTAASVNGFADDQSVLLIDGVKRTTPSSWPTAILIDGEVIGGAPVELNRSGLGDLVSMFTAPADWYLSSLVGMDSGYNDEAAMVARTHGARLLAAAPGIGSGDPEALATLAELLTLSGFSMGVAGQTSPSSGMEHTVSHLLDMAQGSRGEPTALHGAQVGVATVVVAILWRRMARKLADGSLGRFVLPSATDAEALVHAAFDWMDQSGATAAECWRDYSRKLERLRSTNAGVTVSRLVGDWEAHAPRVDELLEAPELIAESLKAAGAPVRFSELGNPPDPDDAVWALTSCHLMRNRFTIADLAFLTGNWTDDDIASVLEEARSMGSGL